MTYAAGAYALRSVVFPTRRGVHPPVASDAAPTMVAPVDATPSEAVRREMLLVRAAIAVLAAHAVVDSFLASEPGTSWDDHLVRGFRAASEPKELWEIPEAGHVGGFQARPREYERRVVGFFDRALGVTSS